MFVTKSQIYVFIACVAFGGVSGMLLSVSSMLKFFLGNKILKIMSDVIFCVLISFFYCEYSYCLSFPNFRVYMPLGVFVGIYLYLKSFHIILAKYVKLLYNIFEVKILRLKNVRANKKRQTNHT